MLLRIIAVLLELDEEKLKLVYRFAYALRGAGPGSKAAR